MRNLVSKRLRPTAKAPFSSTCHLHWPSPDHSLPSSLLGELLAHTATSQNTETGETINTKGGLNIFRIIWHNKFWSSVQAAHPCLRHHCPTVHNKEVMDICPRPSYWLAAAYCLIKITPFCHPGPKHLSGALVKGLNTQGFLRQKKNSHF